MTRRALVVLCAALALTAATVAPVAAAAAPTAPPSTVRLPDGFQPEGITSAGSTFWVGSLRDGTILAGDLRGDVRPRVLLPGADGRQLRGLALDSRSTVLWAVGNVGSVGHVYAVDAYSGRVARDVVVPGAVFLNDLIVTTDAVWVTDSGVQRLTRIALDANGRPAASAPTFLPLSGEWPGAPAGENAANGIVPLDAGHVLLDNSSEGGLWSVGLATGVTVSVPVSGGPAITGGDGLERRGTTVWVVRGVDDDSVSQVQLTGTGRTVSAAYRATLTAASLDVPSTATYALGALYAVNARFGNPSPTTAAYAVTRLEVAGAAGAGTGSG